jgi:hypothetical protein
MFCSFKLHFQSLRTLTKDKISNISKFNVLYSFQIKKIP